MPFLNSFFNSPIKLNFPPPPSHKSASCASLGIGILKMHAAKLHNLNPKILNDYLEEILITHNKGAVCKQSRCYNFDHNSTQSLIKQLN